VGQVSFASPGAGSSTHVSSAKGLVLTADGDPGAALSPLREAVRRWHALDAPYEAARARTVLADVYRQVGEIDAAALELEAAHAIERLGADGAARQVAELLQHNAMRASAAAFLFSDIVGSTTLIEAIGDEPWLGLVEWHDRKLRLLFEDHGGEEVDHAGDGFFVAFPESVAALACAVGIQRALADHRRQHGFAPTIRIGVHAAEAISVGRGYRGKGVHAAARVGAIAGANEIVASRDTAEAGGVRFTNLRVVALKGISEPVEIVSVDWM
jgi:class 3 adenylate cyclase